MVLVVLPLVIIAMLLFPLSSPAGSVTTPVAKSGTAIRAGSPCRDRQGLGAPATRGDGGDCGKAATPFTTPLMGFEPGGNVVAYDGWYYVPVKLGTEPRIRMARFRSLAEMSVLKDARSLLSQKVVWDGAGSPARGFINWPVAMYRLQGRWGTSAVSVGPVRGRCAGGGPAPPRSRAPAASGREGAARPPGPASLCGPFGQSLRTGLGPARQGVRSAPEPRSGRWPTGENPGMTGARRRVEGSGLPQSERGRGRRAHDEGMAPCARGRARGDRVSEAGDGRPGPGAAGGPGAGQGRVGAALLALRAALPGL